MVEMESFQDCNQQAGFQEAQHRKEKKEESESRRAAFIKCFNKLIKGTYNH